MEIGTFLLSPETFHADFTPASHRLQGIFITLTQQRGERPRNKEVMCMFLGLEWYWWLIILVALIISIPFKVKFMKWWSRRQQEKKQEQHGKWGDDE